MATSERRVCVVCGVSLAGKRRHARFCGSICRRESYRVVALLSGRPDSRYTTFAQYDRRTRRRAKRLPGP